MAETECADEHSGHNFVADTEQQDRVEHVVRQRDRGGHGNHIATEQRQLHAVTALSDAVTHGRYAARELRDPARLDHRCLELIRELRQWLVRGEHVVVCGDDGDVGLDVGAQRAFLFAGGGETVREVRTGQAAAGRATSCCVRDASEVRIALLGAPLGDALGGVPQYRMNIAHALAPSCQIRPSRSIRVLAAVGPSVPAG